MKRLFKPIQNKKLSEEIIKQFEDLILSKKLKPGDRLPPERELTEMFSVGRPTIREALRSLEMMGLIEVQQGRGSFIRDMNFNSYIETLKDNVSFLLLSESVTLSEFYGGRKLIEPGISKQIAESHTPEDMESLEKLLADTRDALGDAALFLKFSAMFHRELAERTRNKMVQFTMDFLLTLAPHARLQRFSKRDFMEMVLRDHERILERIRERDGEGAGREMEKHLDNLARGYPID
jgi:DNA-binding FadR family transcriptional regulator